MTSQTANPALDNDTVILPKRDIGKVVCVGRNYAAHAAELGNAVPERPILFIKPASCVVSTHQPISSTFTDVPRGTSYPVHYETELCIRLGRDLKAASVEQVKNMTGLIDAVTLGLDLTLRDLQSELKEAGYPWERAKCFDGACVLGDWILAEGNDADRYKDFSSVHYQLLINDQLTQNGDTAMMLFPIDALLSEISHAFALQAGDVIMTGTPSGVGMLHAGDELVLKLGSHQWSVNVI